MRARHAAWQLPLWGWLLVNTALLYAIYNPSGWSVVDLVQSDRVALPLRMLAALAAFVLIGLVVAATWRSIGLVGVGLGSLFWLLILWALISFEWFDVRSGRAWLWLMPFMAATVLTVGQRGASIWRRWTGQVVVDAD